MIEKDSLQLARAAFARRDWVTAREQFEATGDLPVLDHADLAMACFWLGDVEESVRTNEEVHQRCAAEGATAYAGLAALLVAYLEGLSGNAETSAGWLARSRRFFADVPDAPECGYLLAVDAEFALGAGETEIAARLAEQVLELGNRHHDPTLQALAMFALGVVAVGQRRMDEAHRWFDEAMLPVRAGAVRPEWSGNLYCRMIQLCHELADLPRAQHWTVVTERWCEDASRSMFTGICRVHRVQLLQEHGEWDRALAEARRAAAELEGLDVVVAAEAHYRLGEVQRLRGDLDAAEVAFRRAHEMGRDPLPGLALLHLGRGHGRVAASILDAALAAERTPLGRAPLLAARAEVALAGGDTGVAHRSVAELAEVAEQHESPGWRATAERWRGALLHARGRDADAVSVLREARTQWQRMEAPYWVARIRLDLAETADALGDHDTAERERDQAETTLERLGARRDVERLRSRRGTRRGPGELSPREVEVLAEIAAGISNREAAKALHISDRTVARHLANVYLKTNTSSRTGAVAWARDRGLV